MPIAATGFGRLKTLALQLQGFSLPLVLSFLNGCLKFLKENRQIDRRLIHPVISMIFVSEEAIEPTNTTQE